MHACLKGKLSAHLSQFWASLHIPTYLHKIYRIHHCVFLGGVSLLALLPAAIAIEGYSLQQCRQKRPPSCCDLNHNLQVRPHICIPSVFHPQAILLRTESSRIGFSPTYSNSSPGTASGLLCVCIDIFSAGCTSAAGRDACVATLEREDIDGESRLRLRLLRSL